MGEEKNPEFTAVGEHRKTLGNEPEGYNTENSDETHLLVSEKVMSIGAIAAITSLLVGTFLPSIFSGGTIAEAAGESQTTVVNSRAVVDATIARLEGFQGAIAQAAEEKEQWFTFSAPPSFQGKTIYDVALNDSEKAIALTFDDGPWPKYTEQVLEILKQNNIKATFFWIGQHLQAHPELAKKVVAEGHAIGNHTWNHQYHNVTQETAAKEIGDTADLIYELTGVKSFWFRPPGGVLTNGLNAYAHSQNYVVAMWSSDARESSFPSKSTLINNVLSRAQPGGIVLMHDGGGDRSITVQALPIIIAELKNRGYKFVTLPELLDIYERQNQTPVAAEESNSTTPIPDPMN